MATMADVAVKGLDVLAAAGIVRVRDGEDTWLATEIAWDEAVRDLSDREASDDADASHAYTLLCRKVASESPIASINGTSRGEIAHMVRRAYAAELIDADDAKAFGVVVEVQDEVQS